MILNCTIAQTSNPDTLVINTKNGKIILIGDSLQKFSTFNSNEVINKALFKVKDSLTLEQKKIAYKRHRDSLYTQHKISKFPFRLLPVVGIGVVRDKVSPFLGLSLDFAPQRQDFYFKGGGMYTYINVAAVPYFTFEKDNLNRYHTFHNVFLEGSLGNRINNVKDYGKVSEFSAGVGYLVRKSGPYFEQNMFKIFVTVGIKNSFIRVKPEVLISDNFRTVFPGMGIKIF
ncbi:hypothetical protein WG904_05660 [Pedobacter sp. Du54]|uniref:hypothetical protein n=1 Tax=Pedobacter anseongensis TaxID=3133439 RepID=UPI0030A176A2